MPEVPGGVRRCHLEWCGGGYTQPLPTMALCQALGAAPPNPLGGPLLVAVPGTVWGWRYRGVPPLHTSPPRCWWWGGGCLKGPFVPPAVGRAGAQCQDGGSLPPPPWSSRPRPRPRCGARRHRQHRHPSPSPALMIHPPVPLPPPAPSSHPGELCAVVAVAAVVAAVAAEPGVLGTGGSGGPAAPCPAPHPSVPAPR